jgi:hypothetical protein
MQGIEHTVLIREISNTRTEASGVGNSTLLLRCRLQILVRMYCVIEGYIIDL